MSHFDRPGALAVSIASSLSFTSCLSLGFFIVYLIVRYRGIATENAPGKSGIRFLRTQAGQLFINLLVADFIQAFGFGTSWIWYSRSTISEKSGACVVQALAIEAGDVASALFSLLIALHTAAFLAGSWKPPALALNLVCTGAWVFTVLITAMGPLAVEKQAKGPFYGSAGNWCWITKNYEDERLWLHYLFIFASAIGQLVSYCALFIILRIRVQMERRLDHRAAAEEAPSPTRGGYQSPTTANRPRTSGSALRRKIDKTSLVMLAYPLVNLTVILPLSIFRLSSLAGRPGSPGTLSGCGVIFSLGGFANVVLYSLTRRLLRLPSATDSSDQHIVTPIKGSFEPKQAFHSLNTPDSDITKVESGPNTPAVASIAHTKLKELRLSPSRCTLTITRQPTAATIVASSATTGAGGLLPAANIGRPLQYTRSRSPVSNLSQVNVSQETIVRIES